MVNCGGHFCNLEGLVVWNRISAKIISYIIYIEESLHFTELSPIFRATEDNI